GHSDRAADPRRQGGAAPAGGAGEGVVSLDGHLVVRPAPFLNPTVTTPRIMLDVLIALVPSLAVAVRLFGLSALLVVAAATAGCIATEWTLAPGARGQSL